jgi:hypothetical protein
MAKPFNRSAFKATSTEVSKAKEKEAGLKSRNGGGSDLVYHKIEQGDNKFRFYPYHPDGGGQTYFEHKVVNFLPIEVDVWEDGEKVEGESQIKRKPIFNSKVHGGYPKDLVEEYHAIAKKMAEEMEKNEKKEFLDKVFHYKTGVNTSRGWVVYADKHTDDGQKIFGLLEFSNPVKKEINKTVSAEGDDEVMDNDPFTDPDDGICVIINKTGKLLNTEYSVSLETKKSGKFGYEMIPTPLEDEQLERYLEKDSLFKMFRNVFKRSDFEKQVEGLQRVDQENEFGIFETEEFLSVMEEISDMIPEDVEEDKEEKPKAEKKSVSKKKPTSKPEPTPEPEDDEEEEYEEEEQDEPEEEKEVKPKSEAKMSTADRLAAIRAKMGS